jgi:hypothetical protein
MNEEQMKKVEMEVEQFDFHGVTVLAPKQNNGNELMVVDMGSFLPKIDPTDKEDFKLIRHIANIVLFNKTDFENKRMKPLKEFDPPIKIRVGYTLFDVMECNGDIKQLKLAYWDGSRWVTISDPYHEYRILPHSTAPVAEATIWSWTADTPIAWGK